MASSVLSILIGREGETREIFFSVFSRPSQVIAPGELKIISAPLGVFSASGETVFTIIPFLFAHSRKLRGGEPAKKASFCSFSQKPFIPSAERSVCE